MCCLRSRTMAKRNGLIAKQRLWRAWAFNGVLLEDLL